MQFNGFSVNDIGSFQKHFSMSEVLKEIDRQMAFANWLEDIKYSSGLSKENVRVIFELKECFENFCGIDRKNSEKESEESKKVIDEILWAEKYRNITQQFLTWEEKVEREVQDRYRVFWRMIILLTNLGDYLITGEDEEKIFKYLLDSGMIRKKLLWINYNQNGTAELFYKDNFVDSLTTMKTRNYEGQEFVFVSENPDTGYIGIKQDGSLVNGSAFFIDEIDKRAVKVCHNQKRYVILLEDGSLIHNLKNLIMPEAPVKNIALYGEQLNFILMD